MIFDDVLDLKYVCLLGVFLPGNISFQKIAEGRVFDICFPLLP